MEQTPSLPGHSPELPSVSLPSEKEAKGAFSNPENAPDGLFEHQEQRSGAVPAAEQASVPYNPVVITPTVAQPVDDPSVTQATVSSPTVANDDDLIEKEWVDKAKKVLAETRDDPYRREQEVSRLQADYLMKRYGRELGSLQ